jgi:hypothetical protein
VLEVTTFTADSFLLAVLSSSLEVEFETTSTADSALVTPAWLRFVSPSSPATPPSSGPSASYLLQRLMLPHPRRVLSRTRTRGGRGGAPRGQS